MKIKELMREAVMIKDTATFSDALKLMIDKKSNSLLVIDAHDRLIWWVDVVTLTKAAIPEYLQHQKNAAHFTTDKLFEECILDVRDKKISEFMMTFTKVITEDTSTMEAAIIVTEGRQSKIPVLDDMLKPIWVFTRSSLKKVLAKELWIKY